MPNGDFSQTQDNVQHAVPNGIPPPSFPLPLPDNPETITANALLVAGQAPDPFIYQLLIKHLHAFVRESNLSTDEWMTAIQFLTRVGKNCTALRQEMVLLSDVLGVSSLVDALNNPVAGGATASSILGPFHTDDAEDIELGGSIASEGKGEYMLIEGRVLTTEGKPIADAVLDLWEADQYGFYDMEYAGRTNPDCRGRLRSAEDGSFACRAIYPPPYAIPGDGPVGELLIAQSRHNMRPSHVHIIVEASGYHRLVTALYPDGGEWLASDPVFGVKTSLVVKLEQIDDDAEARRRGFPKGGLFKLLKYDIVMLTEEQSRTLRQQLANKTEELHSKAMIE